MRQLRWISIPLTVVLAACRPEPPVKWAPTVTLAQRGAIDPTVALDSASGTVYVAFASRTSERAADVVLAAIATAGGQPRTTRVNSVPGEVASTKEYPPQVVVGGRDTIYVGWIAYVGDTLSIERSRIFRVARSIDGGKSFGRAVVVGGGADSASSTLAYHDIAASPGGVVVATWVDFSHYTRLAAETEKAGGKVDPWNDVSQRWAEQAELRFARSVDAGATFSAPIVADTLSCICCRTAVASTRDGTSYLMWRHVFDGMERDFVVARAAPNAEPGPAVRVHDDRWRLMGCPDIGPDVAVDGKGRVHVVWYTGAPGQQGLHYAMSGNQGASFGPPVPILTGLDVATSEVKLAIDDDTPWLVWEDRRLREEHGKGPLFGDERSNIRLEMARVSPAGALERLPEPVGNGRTPTIAASRGHLAVAWGDGGRIFLRIGGTPSAR